MFSFTLIIVHFFIVFSTGKKITNGNGQKSNLLVPIMDVISASTPNPFPFEISWSFGICTPTGSKLAIPATSGNAVHNPSGSDCIGKGSLFWSWNTPLRNSWIFHTTSYCIYHSDQKHFKKESRQKNREIEKKTISRKKGFNNSVNLIHLISLVFLFRILKNILAYCATLIKLYWEQDC